MKKLFLKLFLSTLAIVSCTSAEKTTPPANNVIVSEFTKTQRQDYVVTGKKYALATQGILTTKAATEILGKGGNLIDAFVAASFAISVERPQSTGIGGGGFFVFHKSDTKENIVIDFRERAPARASKRMYLDASGEYTSNASKDGPQAAGVPGLIKGLWEIHHKYGKMKWADVIAPAVKIAEDGFFVYPELERALAERHEVLSSYADSKKIFIKSDGSSYKMGDVLIQKDLANTLRAIAKNGEKEFYTGATAKKIVAYYSNMGSRHIQASDLKKYKVIPRQPVEAKFMNYKVVSMPPPSSGGIHVIQFLKMLEKEKWKPTEMNTADVIHKEAAAFQMAFADRAQYLGDPDFVNVPVAQLISDSYLDQRKKEIPTSKARSANEVRFGDVNGKNRKQESTETTHMSFIDSEGNAIASTQTINGWMGSGAVVTGTGVLLNNEMDDFSAKPGTANMFGAIGSIANEIAPFKTPLSSMSPTIVFDETGRAIMSVGAPGGTRIISCTALTIFNHLFFKQSLESSVKNIRIHHQWQPDILYIEKPGPAPAEIDKLRAMGYTIEMGGIPCRVMSAAFNPQNGEFTGVADPRDIGTAAAQ